MKYYSEKLHKLYPTEKELTAAEKEFDDAEAKKIAVQKAEEERMALLKKERATRAKEIDDLFKQRQKLEKTIDAKLKAFTKDYGAYHYSVTDGTLADWTDWLNLVFRMF